MALAPKLPATGSANESAGPLLLQPLLQLLLPPLLPPLAPLANGPPHALAPDVVPTACQQAKPNAQLPWARVGQAGQAFDMAAIITWKVLRRFSDSRA